MSRGRHHKDIITGRCIIGLENVLDFTQYLNVCHLLPALKKLNIINSPTLEVYPEFGSLPIGIEDLNLSSSSDGTEVENIGYFTNLKKLKLLLHKNSDFLWLKNLTQLSSIDIDARFNINPIIPLQCLPVSLVSLTVLSSKIDLGELIHHTVLKGLSTCQLVFKPENPLSTFTQLTYLNVEKISLDDLSGLVNLRRIKMDLDFLDNKPHLTSLNLLRCNLETAQLSVLTQLKNLKDLNVRYNSKLDSSIIDIVLKLISLERLYLSNLIYIDDNGVRALSTLNLLELDLSYCLGVQVIEKWRFPHTHIITP
eukprot:TRINITY_DN5676_c0_g1_i1.p1 TRINITY_DN5676_c0_g1~~TRINITY_DN5676_c0_g1_i1.p1  ORF type:complete len:339 (+),score=87.12 TRINITY_DN5676_c0_g1_i1:90-1019(+)